MRATNSWKHAGQILQDSPGQILQDRFPRTDSPRQILQDSPGFSRTDSPGQILQDRFSRTDSPGFSKTDSPGFLPRRGRHKAGGSWPVAAIRPVAAVALNDSHLSRLSCRSIYRAQNNRHLTSRIQSRRPLNVYGSTLYSVE